MHDINKGRHKFFLDSNIPVYTAGNSSDIRFIERLYSIIKNFNYTTSNYLGTITFYSIEMGIPFFIYGSKQVDINKSDENFPLGLIKEKNNKDLDFLNFKLDYTNFDGTIDREVLKYIEYKLGVNNGISRFRMAFVLWTSLFLWFFSIRSLSFFKISIRKIFNSK
jgi:hypothetical protein